MRRFIVAGAIAVGLLGMPRLADAAGCLTCGEGQPLHAGDDGSLGPGRHDFLIWAITVNSAFTAFDTFHFARFGERNPKVTGIQLVMSCPVTIYGVLFLQRDHRDWATWGLTLWSAGLVVHSFIPVIRHQLGSDDDDAGAAGARRFHIGPTTLVGWDDQQLRVGLSVAGTF